MQVKPGWEKIKNNSLLEPEVTQVIYRQTEPLTDFKIVADFRGVKFDGESAYTSPDPKGVESLAWIVSDAFREALRLKRTRLVMPQ